MMLFSSLFPWTMNKLFCMSSSLIESFDSLALNFQKRDRLVELFIIRALRDLKLSSTCCFLAVSYFDSFLFLSSLKPKQSILAACFLIASKVEEVNPPSINDLCKLGYNLKPETLVTLELKILFVINFKLYSVTIETFLSRLPLDQTGIKMAFCCICDYSILSLFLPSLIAAAIVYKRQKNFGKTGYSLQSVNPVIKHLNTTLSKRKKFMESLIFN